MYTYIHVFVWGVWSTYLNLHLPLYNYLMHGHFRVLSRNDWSKAVDRLDPLHHLVQFLGGHQICLVDNHTISKSKLLHCFVLDSLYMYVGIMRCIKRKIRLD